MSQGGWGGSGSYIRYFYCIPDDGDDDDGYPNGSTECCPCRWLCRCSEPVWWTHDLVALSDNLREDRTLCSETSESSLPISIMTLRLRPRAPFTTNSSYTFAHRPILLCCVRSTYYPRGNRAAPSSKSVPDLRRPDLNATMTTPAPTTG